MGHVDGYELVGIACEDAEGDVAHPVTLSEGKAVICTVTNEDIAPDLTVIKDVINDDGGSAQAGDFQLYVNGDAVDQNEALDVDSNTEYTVTEDQLDGYAFTGIACVDNDTEDSVDHPVTLDEGQSVTCTLTNDDAPASITVVRVVVPDDAAAPDDFDLTITPDGGDAIAALSGVTNAVDANETYTIGETLLDGFVQLDLSCEDSEGPVDHPVELALGQDVTCTITNAESPTITVIKTTDPVDSSLLEFNLDGEQFADSQDVAGDGGSYTWESLEPGGYDLTETTPVDWQIESVECEVEFESLEDGAGLFVDYGDHVTFVSATPQVGSCAHSAGYCSANLRLRPPIVAAWQQSSGFGPLGRTRFGTYRDTTIESSYLSPPSVRIPSGQPGARVPGTQSFTRGSVLGCARTVSSRKGAICRLLSSLSVRAGSQR